ncbi:MAG: hypothetical protein ACP5NC_05385, partial [Nitrososphaeria archaeon]
MSELIERLGGIGAGTALITAGYYIWIIGGYLNPALMLVQWAMTIGGALIVLKALASDHFLANRIFEGRAGLITGAATAAFAAAITAVQGWSQPGYLLVEVFLFSLSAFIIINSSGRTPAFESEFNVKVAALAGFTAVSFIFAYYTSTELSLAFIVIGALGIVGIAFKKLMPVFPILLIVAVVMFSIVLSASIPALSTDELALDSYAAHLVLSGINPYLPASMSRAFQYYHLSLFYETPLTTGGYVSWLSYPALSFLAVIPAVALGIQSRTVLIAVTVALLIAIYLKYRGFGWLSLVPILIALVDVNLIYYPVGSVPDVMWAFLLGLSLATIKRTKLSGSLYGLSLADKQIPLIVAPYLLYMLIREKGARGTLVYASAALVSFLAVNAPFIYLSPGEWLSSMLAPETNNLIGIGQGPGMISFLGYYQLSGRYFTLMEAFTAIMLLVLYVKEYPRYRMSFIAFPILIFFFNYRFLFNYVIYWPVIALLVLPDTLRGVKRAAGWVNRNEGAIALILLAVPLVTAPAFHIQSNAEVNSVNNFSNPLELPGYITQMRVNVSGIADPQFRIFTVGPMVSVNGLLWRYVNYTQGKGWAVYTIEPLVTQESLPQDTGFRIEAYSGSQQAFLNVGPVSISSPLIENPNFTEISGNVPGWTFVPDTQGGRASFSPVQGGVELSALKDRQGWAASQLVQEVNLSALRGYTLVYSVQIAGYGSNVTNSGNPDVAIGIQVDSGQYEVWYLYSSKMGLYRPNPHTTVVLSDSTVINFSETIEI